MKGFSSAIVAFGAVASVTAQTSSGAGVTATPTGPVVQVTFPGDVDSQILVGSLIGIANDATTLALACPAGTDSDDCGFGGGVTITAGPTTLRFALSQFDNSPPLTQECSFTSGGGGVCTITGEADDLDATGSDTAIVTTTTSIAATDLETLPVTITAGDTAGLMNGGASSTSSSRSSTTSAPNAGTGGGAAGNGGGGSNNNGGSSSSTSTPNDAKILVPGGFGAALLGLAAIYL